jgi:hypothetical protein
MKRFGISSFLGGLLVFLAGRLDLTAATNEAPDFKQVYDLIRAHAAGVSDAELNRAAVQGLLKTLGPKVSLVTNVASTNALAETALLNQASLFEGEIAYLRIAWVGDGLVGAVRSAYQRLSSTNKLKGLVLDLRYTDGTDYAAAAAVADLFVTKAEPLLNWGEGIVSSNEKTNALQLPVVVLVNRETARAAEALTALLRQTGTGLILGGTTAGQAMVMQDFQLKDGEHLRIATAPVTMGDGSTLPVQGIKPDVSVIVSPGNERAYYADSFVVLPKTSLVAGAKLSLTNQTNTANLTSSRGRMNEAELVREHKQGANPGADSSSHTRMSEAELVREHKAGLDADGDVDAEAPPARQLEPAGPAVNDPVLARALDLLKGLAVVRQNRF